MMPTVLHYFEILEDIIGRPQSVFFVILTFYAQQQTVRSRIPPFTSIHHLPSHEDDLRL
jgi:hypothetical protein